MEKIVLSEKVKKWFCILEIIWNQVSLHCQKKYRFLLFAERKVELVWEGKTDF